MTAHGGSFVVGSFFGLKTGQTAADIPEKVKKTCGENLGFKKNDIPSIVFARFLEKTQNGVFKILSFASAFSVFGLKTGQTAADIPQKVKKTCSENLGLKKHEIPSLGRLLAPLWAPLGLSWVSLGGSWPPLGGSRAAFGRRVVLLGAFGRSSGSLWSSFGHLVAAPGCNWLLLVAPGCPWAAVGPFLVASGCSWLLSGSSWLLLAVSGCSWLLLAAVGCSWLLLAASGCFWVLLAVFAALGCSWLLLAAFACSWLLLAAPGRPRNPG